MNRQRWSIALLLLTLAASGFAVALVGCRAPGTAPPPPPPAGVPTLLRAAPLPLPRPVRAAWVARFHYRTPANIREIMKNCAAAGFNTVLWQVRGEGTVAYPSSIEPWAREYGHRDPGFDPLAVAVQEAHKHRLRIEAWFNVMPGWKGAVAPVIAGQLYLAHPDWFMYDAAGHRQPLNKDYVILNPCLPEVRRHIVSLADEIAARYDVDGIHLDYVRFAWDGTAKAKQNYPRDARTLALYRRETARGPDDDPRAWDHWRANQVTRIVHEIRLALNRRRPGATLTAAVWRNPRIGYRDYLQNSVAWLRAGLVDALMPMAYTDKLDQFDADINTYRQLVGTRRIVPGVGIYEHKTAEPMDEQLRRCMNWGGDYALFSYASLFPTVEDAGMKPKDQADAQRARGLRRGVLKDFPTR
jgi:uncharacterized lipoprotein YddW (UPF0748 family)